MSSFVSMFDPSLLVLLVMASRNLPARIDMKDTAAIFGIALKDMTIVLQHGDKIGLRPLGTPAQNGCKWFPTARVLELSVQTDFLHKVTKILQAHHKQRNARRKETASAAA